MKTISTNATLINSAGYIDGRGLTVIAHDDTATNCATIEIGGTEHRRDDLDISGGLIRSKLAGWEIVL